MSSNTEPTNLSEPSNGRPLAFQVDREDQSSGARISFADVAHQTIVFDSAEESSRLILALIDTAWMQRLRRIRQTGYTSLVYMFAEHSRFGHSIGVAYLANRLMKNLMRHSSSAIEPFRNAVAAAALLHDIGHVAPGSHLAERVWAKDAPIDHESLTTRIIREDREICQILESFQTGLTELVCEILEDKDSVPPWTRAIISGGGLERGPWKLDNCR